MTEPNPLLQTGFRIPFQAIRPRHVVPAIRATLSSVDSALDGIRTFQGTGSYENTVAGLDRELERLDRVTAPVRNLLGVADSEDLREAWKTVLPELAAFYAKIGQDEQLFEALTAFAATEDGQGLEPIRARRLEKLIREFRRSGVDRPPDIKQRIQEIQVDLARLSREFGDHVLDATNAFEHHVEAEDTLDGIPANIVATARERAEGDGKEGWIFGLGAPTVLAVLRHAENRELRETVYRAWVSRALEDEFDNVGTITQLIALRRELADLLGYGDFSDYQTEERMVKNGARAVRFLEELGEAALPFFEVDRTTLQEGAARRGYDRLEPWDTNFLSEQIRKEHFGLDEQELRPYFAVGAVQKGLFRLCEGLFGIRIEERQNEAVWHPDVGYFDILDQHDTHLASFYTDLFNRVDKRDGAWMASFVTGGPSADGGAFTPHLGVICANFAPATEDTPALLTHQEVLTLFHEFGHLLHHSLSEVTLPALSGTRVAWDFVELPSQIMENWAWDLEALQGFARHHETGELLPEDLHRRMVAARQFMGGRVQTGRIMLSLLDLKLHREYDPEVEGPLIPYVKAAISPMAMGENFLDGHRITSFNHLFAGGYAAGYYSYLWAGVLEADAFGRFLAEGVLNPELGRTYRDAILARGDSEDPEVLFKQFMGRDPDPRAYIERELGSPGEDQKLALTARP